MWTKAWWKDTGERVISTVAQTLLGIFTAVGFDLLAFDVTVALAVVVTAGLVSFLKCVVAGTTDSTHVSPASLVKEPR